MTTSTKNPPAPGRIGDWMCTFTGKQFYPADPRPEEVCIEDIAHALAIENRFGGHLPQPYSVGQHCLFASILVEALGGTKEQQLAALLHDAAEAYIKDIPRPLKRQLQGYAEIEEKVERAIAEAFGLKNADPFADPLVKKADEIMLTLERRDLFPASHQQLWTLGGTEPLPDGLPTLLPMGWRDVEKIFRNRFISLRIRFFTD